MIGLTRIYKVNGHYVVAKSPEDAIRIYQEGEDDKIKDILEVRLLADGKYPDFAYIDKGEPTEETELNSIAFLEQMGYTCIPQGKEQKPTNSEKPKEWSEEDEILRIRTINRLEILNFHGISGKEIRESIDWLKFLRPQPHWKPSEEQMEALKYALGKGGAFNKEALEGLYEQLKKL